MKSPLPLTQPSLFDEPSQESPARTHRMTQDEGKATMSSPTPSVPLANPDDADRRSYAGLADYIAGR